MFNAMEEHLSLQESEPKHFGPDAVLATPFGSVSNRSAAIRLCTSREQSFALKNGSGEYRSMRSFKTLVNSELYKYLRLGVSSQSVKAFKALGYMTPESLQESPEVNAMLPDILAREDREYPLEFIDQCEEAGISALECQMALRRGITTSHLNGKADARQLVSMFNRYVNREGLKLPMNGQKSIIDYFVDGTIPIELQDSESFLPENVVTTVRYCLKNDEPFLAELNADLSLFGKFVRTVQTGYKNGVGELRSIIAKYGYEALDLPNPYWCSLTIHADDGSSHKAGYQVVAYIEEIVKVTLGSYASQRLKIVDGAITFAGRNIELLDFEKAMEAGIAPKEFRQFVISEKMSVQAFLTAKNDGVINPFMTGSL